jgi:hypothetical protein
MGDIRTVEFSATGYDFVLGQNYNGASPWPKFIQRIIPVHYAADNRIVTMVEVRRVSGRN